MESGVYRSFSVLMSDADFYLSSIRNSVGERLDTALTKGKVDDSRLVVIAHGVTSHHDRPWLVALSEACAGLGLASLRVSFAGNGKSEGLYEEATISKEVEDIRSVLDACGRAGFKTLGYAGHSMGAAVGVLAAARDERIRALVSLAGMVHVQTFVARHFGHHAVGDALLEKPHCRLSQAYLDDSAEIGHVLEEARGVVVPWLLLHGDNDELVPLKDAEDAQSENGCCELAVVPGSDHRFSGCEAQVAGQAAQWFDRNLKRC